MGALFVKKIINNTKQFLIALEIVTEIKNDTHTEINTYGSTDTDNNELLNNWRQTELLMDSGLNIQLHFYVKILISKSCFFWSIFLEVDTFSMK